MWTALAWAVGLVGLYVRLHDLGRWGFWNDEAWVALSTRVEGFSQFWLSLSVTPIAWAGVLRGMARVFSAPEFTLRLLPLAFSMLTLWAAYRAGRELSGHPLGGVLATAVLALDPPSVQHAKVLKHYSAEAFFAVLALGEAARAARDAPGALARLVVVLLVGLGFANAQLLVGPPLLAALLVRAALRGDREALGRSAVAGAVVGAVDLAAYRWLVAPRLTPAVDAYWAESAAPPAGFADAAWAALGGLGAGLEAMWGGAALWLALAALGAAALVSAPQRTLLLATGALVLGLAALSLSRPVPLGEPRLVLFLTSLVSVQAAAGLAGAALLLWRRRVLRPVAALGLALVAADVSRTRPWKALREVAQVEDLGPLVRFLAAARRPGEPVLLYGRSLYVHAYYQSATPVLVPNPGTTVGYHPRLDDPDVLLVDGRSAATAAASALAQSPQVWLVGSRFRAGDEQRLRDALVAHGTPVLEARRPRALLMLVRR